MVHFFCVLCSAEDAEWDGSIFIRVEYPSTTQGTAHTQPESKGDFLAVLGMLHKQVK